MRDVFWPGVRERAGRHEINLELRVDFYTDDLILVLTDTDPERKSLFLSRKEMNGCAFENEEASERLDRLIAELTFPAISLAGT